VILKVPGVFGPIITCPSGDVGPVTTASNTETARRKTTGGIAIKISRFDSTRPLSTAVGFTGTKTRTSRDLFAVTNFLPATPSTFGAVAAERDVTEKTAGEAKLIVANATRARRPLGKARVSALAKLLFIRPKIAFH
jgi:hypothetical protein